MNVKNELKKLNEELLIVNEKKITLENEVAERKNIRMNKQLIKTLVFEKQKIKKEILELVNVIERRGKIKVSDNSFYGCNCCGLRLKDNIEVRIGSMSSTICKCCLEELKTKLGEK